MLADNVTLFTFAAECHADGCLAGQAVDRHLLLLGSQQQTRHSSIRQLKDGMVDIA